MSVTVSVVSERHGASASLRSWNTVSWPRAWASVRTVAKARLPSASVISSTPALAPRMVSGCVSPSTSMQSRADRAAGRRGRGDDAVGVAEQDAAAERGGAHRQRAFEQIAPRGVAAFRVRQPVESLGDEVGDIVDVVDRLGDRLAAVVEHLHDGADADGQQEGDDQRRHRAAQRGLGDQQPAVGGIGDRLRQTLDRIRLRGRTRRFGARHAPSPCWMIP